PAPEHLPRELEQDPPVHRGQDVGGRDGGLRGGVHGLPCSLVVVTTAVCPTAARPRRGAEPPCCGDLRRRRGTGRSR
ncbi:hypothetical protein NPS74_24405, partial [Cutibacterium acnes subsp. acnes]|nr:hypothetical protein [Cutibacterium acnes subsp. acnes]